MTLQPERFHKMLVIIWIIQEGEKDRNLMLSRSLLVAHDRKTCKTSFTNLSDDVISE